MSQLLDSLRRAGRQRAPSPEHAQRTARADAVLATLGYKTTPPRRLTTPILLVIAAVIAVGGITWHLWPARPAPGTAAPVSNAGKPSAPAVRPSPNLPSETAPPGASPTSIPDPAIVATRPPESAAPGPRAQPRVPETARPAPRIDRPPGPAAPASTSA